MNKYNGLPVKFVYCLMLLRKLSTFFLKNFTFPKRLFLSNIIFILFQNLAMLAKKQLIYLGTIMLISTLLDQLSKVYVRENLAYMNEIQLIGPYFILTKIENTGAFLSLGANASSWVHTLTIILLPSFIILGLLGYVLSRKSLSSLSVWGYGCLIGGGLSNMIDRIRFGSVTDFMHIDLGFAQTGIFNIADICIMIGIGLLMLESWRK